MKGHTMTRTRTRTLLALLALVALGLVVAQGMMDDRNAQPWRQHGRTGPASMAGGYGGYGTMGHGTMGPTMGRGMMGSMSGGMGMMQILPSNATPLSDAELRERLDAAAAAFGPEVRVVDVMPFVNHTYAQFVDADGAGLAEMLVDRYTGIVMPEPGPNMMWNRSTGMGFATAPTQRYDEAAARGLAEDFLVGFLPGADVLSAQAFAGYVTFDYGREGRVDGMLSVNTTTGLIWPHAWHGAYIGDAHD
jgi:hypothetical protein